LDREGEGFGVLKKPPWGVTPQAVTDFEKRSDQIQRRVQTRRGLKELRGGKVGWFEGQGGRLGDGVKEGRVRGATVTIDN